MYILWCNIVGSAAVIIVVVVVVVVINLLAFSNVLSWLRYSIRYLCFTIIQIVRNSLLTMAVSE